MKLIFSASLLLSVSIGQPSLSQDTARLMPVVDVSSKTLEWMDRIPRMPDDGFSCVGEVKSFRANLSAKRETLIRSFEAYRTNVCRDIKLFDKETEALRSSGHLAPNLYSSRKEAYYYEFDEHCNDSREARSGLLGLHDSLSGGLSGVEKASYEMLNECYSSGACYAGRCEGS